MEIITDKLKQIDSNWTLFLDRDGVINHEKHLGYINTWDEFTFYEGVKEAIKIFTPRFKHIVVVTNQKGVGKGITQLEDLYIIHQNMISEIETAGGRIDKIYFCPDLEETSTDRKPNPGMAFRARQDFPEIDFSRSIMVGNTLGDMQFGRNIGALTIFLPTTRPESEHTDERIDAVYTSLLHFAKAL
jgi:D-glycero-D-manno-heptose 1,7-bisphosphate phosphatase